MLIELLIILVLVLLNGVFSMTELAVVSARRGRLQHAAERGSTGATAALLLQSQPTRFLSTVQIGITLVGVLTGALGGATLAEPLASVLTPIPVIGPYASALAFSLVVLGIGFATLVLGELVPKRVGMTNPEVIATIAAPILRPLMIVCAPFIWTLSHTTELLLRLFPKTPIDADAQADEEIKLLLREGAEAGAFHETERNIVEQTLRLDDRRVSALMTPRPQLETLDLSDPPEVNQARLLESGHSRFPVIEGDWSHVAGIVGIRDLMSAAMAGKPFDLRAAVKPVLYIPDTASALTAVETFKREGAPLALIIDEYGDIQGLVTLNDLLEALVGDIGDPEEGDVLTVVRREDGSWLIDGMMQVDEVFDRIGLDPPEPADERDYDTLGGFVMARLKRIPQTADHFEVAGFRFEVMDMDGRRVDKMLVVPPPPS